MNLKYKEILEEMKLSKRFLKIEDNHFYSPKADNYLMEMEKYASYCLENKRSEWGSWIQKIIGLTGILSDEIICLYLFCFECAALIMKMYDKTEDKYIKEIVEMQSHTEESLSVLCQIMLQFSKNGKAFVENILQINPREFKKSIKKQYALEKQYKSIRILQKNKRS